MKARRWQDGFMLVLGAWLFFSPFWMDSYADAGSAAGWNSYIFGVVVFVISWVALARPRRWEEWLNAVIGLWLIVAPFVLGFSSVLGATWNHVIVGVLIGADAISVLARSRMQTVTQA